MMIAVETGGRDHAQAACTLRYFRDEYHEHIENKTLRRSGWHDISSCETATVNSG